jgi:hypothetical protein
VIPLETGDASYLQWIFDSTTEVER